MVIPTVTWVVVASRVRARIFEHRGPSKGLVLVGEHDFPKGRKQDAEIDTDRAGRMRRPTGRPHPATHRQDAHEHLAESFAQSIGEHLRAARVEGRFAQLILVAEAHFLGVLRSALDPPTSKLVSGSLSKDLDKVRVDQIEKQLESILAV